MAAPPTTAATLESFRAAFKGTLIGPGDAGYDEARAVYNAMIDRRPALIARCADAADVIARRQLRARAGLPLAVRGGGHNAGGLGVCDDALVIDLSDMTRRARRPGDRARARRRRRDAGPSVDRATHAFGLAVPAGIISHHRRRRADARRRPRLPRRAGTA